MIMKCMQFKKLNTMIHVIIFAGFCANLTKIKEENITNIPLFEMTRSICRTTLHRYDTLCNGAKCYVFYIFLQKYALILCSVWDKFRCLCRKIKCVQNDTLFDSYYFQWPFAMLILEGVCMWGGFVACTYYVWKIKVSIFFMYTSLHYIKKKHIVKTKIQNMSNMYSDGPTSY